MNDLTVWAYENAEVRTIVKDGAPWWVLKDVCNVLELTTPTRVAERLEDDEVSQTHIIDAQSRKKAGNINHIKAPAYSAGVKKRILRIIHCHFVEKLLQKTHFEFFSVLHVLLK